jgi:hypothetical protein
VWLGRYGSGSSADALSRAKRSQGHIEDPATLHPHGRDSKAAIRAIGDVVIILTNGSKQFRLASVEVFEVLKDRFALCGSKFVAALIT